MILEKLKIYILLLALISVSVIAGDKNNYEKEIEEIKATQELIQYEKNGIKNLIKQLKKLDDRSPQKLSLKKLLKQKHKELNIKIEELNEIISAISYNTDSITKNSVKKTQTIDEIEDEMGIDRVITSVKKNVDKTYKDFISTPEHKAWQKKKKDHFRIEEQKQKIILVE